MIKRIILFLLYSIIYYIPNLFRELYLYTFRKDILILNAFLDYKFGTFHHYNWGDDINKLFLADELKKNVIHYQNSFISRTRKYDNFMCIGSMLHDCNSQTIVWGSGFLSDDKKFNLKESPKEILSVRGKLSREVLLKQGIDCPEIYGDPALLLPLFYNPNVKKRYKLGIIPHIYDENNPLLKELNHKNEIIIITLHNYKDWHQIIDKINECELIFSSSLHGIIVADSYGIPNVWVEFSDKVIGNGFKFRDYYSSVSRNITAPVKIMKPINIDNINSYKEEYHPPIYDCRKIIEVCPFTSLRTRMLELYIKRNETTISSL